MPVVVLMVAVGVPAVLAVWPPRRPLWWRDLTRPIRKKIWPQRYERF